MFWKTQIEESSGIANLLSKQDITLTEVLDDPYALQELKCSNQSLIDFLKTAEILSQLTKLTLTEPPECPKESDAKRYKYFHLASEILSADSEQVTSALSQSQESFEYLSDFVKAKETLNPLLASSFAKIFSLLAQRFPSQTLTFMQNDSQFLDNCLYHLETYAIADALFRICACIENDEEALKIRSWLCEQLFVAKLVAKFANDCSDESHVNAAFLMNELIRCLRDLVYSRDDKTLDPLLEQLQSRTNLDSLLSNMFALPRNDSVLVNGCSVFLTLLQTLPTSFNLTEWNFSKSIENGIQDDHSRMRIDDQWSPDPDGVVVSCLHNRLEDFIRLISNKNENLSPLLTPMGRIDPFSTARLTCLKVVTQLITSNSFEIHQRLSELNVLDTLFECFFAYPFNNFLHSCVYHFVYFVLNLQLTSATNEEKLPSPVLKQVFKNGNILKMLLDKYASNQKENRKRSTNFGHLMKIAEIIDQSMTAGVNVVYTKDISKEFTEECQQSWTRFVSDVLVPYKKMNEPDPVGIQSSSLDILREDLPPVSASIHQQNQRFVEYQTQQMTDSFPEPTGFPPDTFTSDRQENINDTLAKTTDITIKMDGKDKVSPPGESAFDALCEQKISTMDSDEDDWPEREITFTSSSVITNQRSDYEGRSYVNKRSSSSSSNDEENGETSSKMDVDQGPSDWANFQTNDLTPSKDDWTTFGAASNSLETVSKTKNDDDNWANFDAKSPPNKQLESNDWANFQQQNFWTNNVDASPVSQGIASATMSSNDWDFEFGSTRQKTTPDSKKCSTQSNDRSSQYAKPEEKTSQDGKH